MHAVLNGIGKDGPGSSEPTNEKDGKRPEMSVMKWRTAESYTCIKQLEELSERLSTLPD